MQIKEAISRYQTQAARIERLQQQDAELKASTTLQLKKKQELSEHLVQTQVKIQQLASSRQIYQEVDLKDHALANATKEYEEAKERDFRLRLHIESLKQSIPRFLTKLTKTFHMKPNENLVCNNFDTDFFTLCGCLLNNGLCYSYFSWAMHVSSSTTK